MDIKKIFSKEAGVYLSDVIINSLSAYKQNYLKRKEEQASLKWLEKFSSNQLSFIHKLDDEVQIKLYKDSSYSRFLYEGLEKEEVLFVKRFLMKGDVFFDVGSNIGVYSNVAASVVGPEGEVYAFEPTPITYKRLVENITLNKYGNIVKAVNAGLSDKSGNLKLKMSSNGMDAWNSFVANPKLENSLEVDVVVYALDEFLESNKFSKQIALIKIDVEGWELQVFKGGERLLSAPDAPTLLVEFTDENTFSAGYSCNQLYDFIVSLGYRWYRYNADTNSLIEQPKKMYYPYENLIAIKNLSIVSDRIKSTIY
ncbi:FkbM family methyltransferase [Lacibacter sp. H375]|uniref:FkbM family methyltransferase n=1 Tax=Lacibacter sp. H375 TaxID=3133424 RepID=UPI0030C364F7